MELPPRARRIRERLPFRLHLLGTTSACAENTVFSGSGVFATRNYLRVRGEYTRDIDPCGQPWELPPRARRILSGSRGIRPRAGTTSACAENTGALGGIEQEKWNYLRVRGEYRRTAWEAASTAELPPRARRIQGVIPVHPVVIGTTSACAENTMPNHGPTYRGGNYLRVRGEYTYTGNIYGGQKELPPRARRILAKDTASRPNAGTTSACAENTGKTPCPCRRVRNYLRVRGEYHMSHRFNTWTLELPPRARRIQLG